VFQDKLKLFQVKFLKTFFRFGGGPPLIQINQDFKINYQKKRNENISKEKLKEKSQISRRKN
jgi:hypothetical protein